MGGAPTLSDPIVSSAIVNPPWTPPQEFDGYKVRGLLGRGGMGEVYLGHDTLLDRPVAIKFIRSAHARAREMLLNEARAAAKLQHPNVVAIYRVGEIDGRPYIVSEYIRGRGLHQLALPLPWQQALELAIALCRGLAAAHRRGILHRDLKLSNAILSDDGEIKLLDFGLAKFIENPAAAEDLPALPNLGEPATERHEDSQVTIDATARPAGGAARPLLSPMLTGEVPALTLEEPPPRPPPPPTPPTPPPPAERVAIHDQPLSKNSDTESSAIAGTPVYMAPEVLRGEPSSRRSDIYSMGALLYALCTRDPPFRGLPFMDLVRVVNEVDALPLGEVVTDILPGFAQVVDRCLRRSPSDRYAGADELREALEALLPSSQPARASVPEGNPYRGLLPFEPKDRALLFGRRSEVGTLVERLRTETSLLIVGDSGVGKSSLVRAGLLPLLAEGALGSHRTWHHAVMTPGRHPHNALLGALRELLGVSRTQLWQRLNKEPRALGRELSGLLQETRGAVLVVDQLEELISQSDVAEAEWTAEALGSIIGVSSGFRLIMTARADALPRLGELPLLGEEIGRAFYLLRPLSREKLHEVIVGPARCTGVSFESPALIDQLIEAAADTDGGLPLLQFALAELWEARSGDVITKQVLQSIGGVEGALSRHADQILARLLPAQQVEARRILLHLLTETGARTRRGHDELIQGSDLADEVLEKLVQGRLVVARETPEGATYELAHEILIKSWPRLRSFIERQGERRAIYQRLTQSASEWQRLGKRQEGLWAARQLDEAQSLDSYEIGPHEDAFLTASRQHVARQRLLRLGALLALPAVCALLGLGIFFGSRRAAYKQVSDLVLRGRIYLEEVHKLDREVLAIEKQSMQAFDQQHIAEGERLWIEVLKKRKLRQKAQTNTVAFSKSANKSTSRSRPDALRFGAEVYYTLVDIGAREHNYEQVDVGLAKFWRYDQTGEMTARWNQPAHLQLRSVPYGAEVELQRILDGEDKTRRLGDPRRLGQTPIASLELEPGAYLLTLRAAEHAEVHYPLLLERGAQFSTEIVMPRDSAVPPGYVYVPPGAAQFGTYHDEEVRSVVMQTVPIHTVDVPGFLISRHEVTYGQWLEYLRATQPAAQPPLPGPAKAPPPPSTIDAMTRPMTLTLRPDGRFDLALRIGHTIYTATEGEPIVYAARKDRPKQDWRKLPVSGILPEEAMAFAAWLNTRRRPRWARLCSELEWERAARGADDREFPHGDAMAPSDANFGDTHDDGDAEAPVAGPDEVGSYPISVSPLLIFDLAGNVSEWTTSTLRPGQFVLRGGYFHSPRHNLRIATRQPADPTQRDIAAGLRICASL